jgi:hypothetical protein
VENMTQTEVMGTILTGIRAWIEMNTNSTSDITEETDLVQHTAADQAAHSNWMQDVPILFKDHTWKVE